MLNIETTTRLSPEEAIKSAVEFFGPEGYGMEVASRDKCCAEFQGGGGGVTVTVISRDKGATVSLISREWDYQVRDFIDKIK